MKTFAKIFLQLAIIQTVQCQAESVKRCARDADVCLLAEATRGSYYWNTTVRQDIAEGRPDIPLQLSITILNTNCCSPVPNALVDLWYCDSLGIYSHYIAASLGAMNSLNDNFTFLRGQQVTNSEGMATFATIYPGWYRGRATHIHIKVHIGANLTNIDGAIYAKGGHVSHTDPLFFFDDELTDRVATIAPYSIRRIRRLRNNEDEIYEDSNGATMLISIESLESDFTKGMTGEITVGIDPSATS